MIVRVNNTDYPLITAYPFRAGAEFQYRDAFFLSVEMDWHTAHELFVDGAEWTLVGGTDVDFSEYRIAGTIADHRNGCIDIVMGKKTEAEVLTEELMDAKAALSLLGVTEATEDDNA